MFAVLLFWQQFHNSGARQMKKTFLCVLVGLSFMASPTSFAFGSESEYTYWNYGAGAQSCGKWVKSGKGMIGTGWVNGCLDILVRLDAMERN